MSRKAPRHATTYETHLSVNVELLLDTHGRTWGVRVVENRDPIGVHGQTQVYVGFETHDELLDWLVYRLERKFAAAADLARSRLAARVARGGLTTNETRVSEGREG